MPCNESFIVCRVSKDWKVSHTNKVVTHSLPLFTLLSSQSTVVGTQDKAFSPQGIIRKANFTNINCWVWSSPVKGESLNDKITFILLAVQRVLQDWHPQNIHQDRCDFYKPKNIFHYRESNDSEKENLKRGNWWYQKKCLCKHAWRWQHTSLPTTWHLPKSGFCSEVHLSPHNSSIL